MFTLFSNPLYLVGAAGILLPLVIHLLTRERVRRVAFSTLRFFVRNSRATLARKRFQEALLILLRMAACLLLALAFANPQSGCGRKDAHEGTGTARVLVVDVSGSMSRPEAAKAMAKALGDAVPSGEGGARPALIAFDDSARVVCGFDADATELSRALAELKPGQGASNLDAALRKAADLIAQEKAAKKQIVLISDLQKTGWSHYRGAWRLSRGMELVVRPVVVDHAEDNVAIVQADVPQSLVRDGQPRTLNARIMNYGAGKREGVKVTLTVNGKDVESRVITLPAAAAVAVRFRAAFDADVDNAGAIRVTAEDADPADNVFYFNVRVVPRIPVVILNGCPAARPQDDAAFFFKTAMTVGEQTPFDVRVVKAADAQPQDLAGAAVVIVADADTVSAPVAAAMRAIMEKGGGALFLPGRSVDPARFGRTFGDLAPCGLRQVLAPRISQQFAKETTLTDLDYNHPIFDVFSMSHHGNFGSIAFLKYWEVIGSQAARVLGRFDDGHPAILEKRIGKGASILSMTPGDLEWNDFPHRVLFIPYVHQVVQYLGAHTEQRTAYAVGDVPVFPAKTVVRDDQGRVLTGPDAATASPGLRLVTPPAGSGGAPFRVAVNRDISEADPAVVEPAEIKEALRVGSEDDEDAPAGKAEPKGPLARRERWMAVLLAFCILAVAELAVGNRTIRH